MLIRIKRGAQGDNSRVVTQVGHRNNLPIIQTSRLAREGEVLPDFRWPMHDVDEAILVDQRATKVASRSSVVKGDNVRTLRILLLLLALLHHEVAAGCCSDGCDASDGNGRYGCRYDDCNAT